MVVAAGGRWALSGSPGRGDRWNRAQLCHPSPTPRAASRRETGGGSIHSSGRIHLPVDTGADLCSGRASGVWAAPMVERGCKGLPDPAKLRLSCCLHRRPHLKWALQSRPPGLGKRPCFGRRCGRAHCWKLKIVGPRLRTAGRAIAAFPEEAEARDVPGRGPVNFGCVWVDSTWTPARQPEKGDPRRTAATRMGLRGTITQVL